MKLKIYIQLITFTGVFLLLSMNLMAQDAGSRGAYTRSGWAGARYVAMGMSGEVMADDVYSIYWNPAGLVELKGRSNLSVQEVQNKARDGNIDDVSEDDLLNFSDEDSERFFIQIGLSAAKLDIERNVGFTGAAFKLFDGVMGVGVYSLFSLDIQTRDDAGNYTGTEDYAGSIGYLSYGWNIGVASFGVSLKYLHEQIGDVTYMGAGADVGVQVYVLPFLKIGFMAQDLGSGFAPTGNDDGISKRYDFVSPTLRLGLAFVSDAGISVALSGIKKFEQEKFFFNLGVQYELARYAAFYVGLNDLNFSCGLTITLYNVEISYAFTIDNVDNGYNNLVSAAVIF